ncbi:FtsQ-type POTRA domain-containing protein [Lachnospiraceae bacterium PAL113]|uniref:FtsQ-type POTRA domain-containing protein n=1 Tax=Aequitasia blattaphilus TaxID=2949332 RepID=A0ABT1E673_9FIRM|nr:FtsQ-type POTRA domain-containing protein [Aequitasia blattaphilus]MCR8613975.1 FtsQ-type POTRA domain-containing protein [Aequitasia blattaphilus]
MSVRIYHFFTALIGIGIVALSLFVFFHIQKIEVSGNEYTDSNSITELITEDPYGTNTLYVCGKYMLGKGKSLPHLDSIKVSIGKPWVLKVHVKEKTVSGYIENENGIFYFDGEGMVVLKSNTHTIDVPLIEGVEIGELNLYESLKTEEKEVFKELLEATRLLQTQEIHADKVVYKNNSIYVYYGAVYVNLGTKVSEDQILQLPPIIEKLEGQEGTLHMEDYQRGNHTITFKKGEIPPDS